MAWHPREDFEIPADDFIEAVREGEIPNYMAADALAIAKARIHREMAHLDADWAADEAERATLVVRSLDQALMSGSCAPGNWWVYLLIAEPRDIVYVGISSNLLARLGQHASARRGLFQRVALVECPGEQVARRTEASLIRMLSPRLNIMGKPRVA